MVHLLHSADHIECVMLWATVAESARMRRGKYMQYPSGVAWHDHHSWWYHCHVMIDHVHTHCYMGVSVRWLTGGSCSCLWSISRCHVGQTQDEINYYDVTISHQTIIFSIWWPCLQQSCSCHTDHHHHSAILHTWLFAKIMLKIYFK